MNELVFSEVNLIGTLAYCDDHPATIGLLRDGKVDAAQFITGRIALDDLVSRVWVPDILCTSCDLLVLVDEASESVRRRMLFVGSLVSWGRSGRSGAAWPRAR